MPDTVLVNPAAPTSASSVYPLDELYARAGLPLPRIELISGETMPEPYRSLLVHDNDMTPTLETHHGCDIHIEVWGRERHGNSYFREVVLRRDTDQHAVEFGANRMDLALFSAEERRLILDEYLPLGHILQMKRVPHHGHPKAYLRVEADDLMKRAFGFSENQALYGRRNTIWNPDDRPLSEIVEILPPMKSNEGL